MVKVQYSKYHESSQIFWYGIFPSSHRQAKDLGCTDYVFIMGQDGFVVVPVETLDTYLENAYVTKNADGTVRHYHIHLSPPPEVFLKSSGNLSDIDVSASFETLN